VGYVAVDPPVFPFLLKHLQLFLEEGSIGLCEVVVIVGQTLLGPFHGVEGLPVILKFHVADAHIGQGQSIGGVMFHSIFVALRSLLVIQLAFIDVA
jgi:hypothetical protein